MAHGTLEHLHDKPMDGLEFCRLVYERFEEVQAQPEGSKVLRQRHRPEKKLLEELFPLCRYIQTFYGPGQYLTVRWLDGSQSYDAMVTTRGAMVDQGGWPEEETIEITQAQHPNEHLMRELLNTEGGGFGLDGLAVVRGENGERRIESVPISYSNQSYVTTMCEIVVKAIEAKATKMAKGTYPSGTTLIVDCVLMTLFNRSEWDTLVAAVRAALRPNGFARIFATANAAGYTAIL